MKRSNTLLVALCGAAFLSACQTAPAPMAAAGPSTASAPLPAGQPKLTVVISVDQFAADLFDAYRPSFTGGLKRLSSGIAYSNGYQSHAATETCPGHSTQLTGARPYRTGIVANTWVDQSIARDDKSVYCAEDETQPGTTSRAYKASVRHLNVPTLGDLIEQADPARQTVAVAGKDRAAIMMGGHNPDQRWFWDGKAFVTDLPGRATPKAVVAATAATQALVAAPSAPLDVPAACAQRSRPVTVPGLAKPIGNGRFERAAGDANAFRAHPAYDGAVLALAAGLVQEMRLGADARGDLLTVGLSATDYVGHGYGNGGQEMCLQLASLDRDLGDFLAFLDRTVGDYAVVLTADHGGEDIPERLAVAGVPTAHRVSKELTIDALNAAVSASLGRTLRWFSGPGIAGDLYLDRSVTGTDRDRALAAARQWLDGQGDIAFTFDKAQVTATPVPTGDPTRWTPIQRVRASFDPARSGDLVTGLRAHVNSIASGGAGYVATHGSIWDYDRRVPILFWRPGVQPQDRAAYAETVDIAPTLGALIGVPMNPASIDGRCLKDVAATC